MSREPRPTARAEREDDSAEEDAEGEFDDGAADLEVVEDHGGGEDLDEPLDAEGEEAGVLELGVYSADEDGRSRKRAMTLPAMSRRTAPMEWVR